MNIVLANKGYSTHMTDEGWQLQEGLRVNGWKLVGPQYPWSDGAHGSLQGFQDVRQILKYYDPNHVFVQDKRDWDPASECPGATAQTKFHHLRALKTARARVSLVVKDAGPEGADYHRQFCDEVDPDAVVIYYHPLSVLKHSPYLQSFKLVRIYHSLDRTAVPPFTPGENRKAILGSGAVLKDVYPLRHRARASKDFLGMDWLPHPGYQNEKGPATPLYLQMLNAYKVSLCTASAYGFALRKIIESVACGCTVVTDLPTYDVLPEIDRALIRVKPTITETELQTILKDAAECWEEEGRRRWAEKAIAYYDYKIAGRRMSDALQKV